MPWESGSMVAGSPSNKRNVGVLEVKMKQRLEQDHEAVAIGSLRHSPSRSDNNHHHVKRSKRVHKLPQLQHSRSEPDARPPSFEVARSQVMDGLELPSPTRSLIEKHVEHAKHEDEARKNALPPVAGAFKKRAAPRSLFPQAYQRGELPIMVESKAGGQTLRWTQDIKTLDFAKLLPLFLSGMRETSFPFSFMAREGAFQLLQFGHQYPERVLDCLPQTIPAVRSILDLREAQHMRDALLVIQRLARIDGVGLALVPYYRQLLPTLNLFKAKRRNMGDSIDFQQHSAKDVGEMIVETLELLEAVGGHDAYVNIKYMVPTYEGAQMHK